MRNLTLATLNVRGLRDEKYLHSMHRFFRFHFRTPYILAIQETHLLQTDERSCPWPKNSFILGYAESIHCGTIFFLSNSPLFCPIFFCPFWKINYLNWLFFLSSVQLWRKNSSKLFDFLVNYLLLRSIFFLPKTNRST